MSDLDRVQAFAIVVCVTLLLVVIDLVRRRKLVEEYAVLWIAGSVVLLVLAIWRQILQTATVQLGVYYPPTVMLLLLGILVLAVLLWFSVVLSRQRRQIDRLTEETAILGAELRELRRPTAGHAESPDPKRPRA